MRVSYYSLVLTVWCFGLLGLLGWYVLCSGGVHLVTLFRVSMVVFMFLGLLVGWCVFSI